MIEIRNAQPVYKSMEFGSFKDMIDYGTENPFTDLDITVVVISENDDRECSIKMTCDAKKVRPFADGLFNDFVFLYGMLEERGGKERLSVLFLKTLIVNE